MAEKIQLPIVGENLREFFRLTGSVRPELEEGVLPTVLVGDLSTSSAPVRRRHCAAQGSQVAAALQNAFFELSSNDPGTLAVVTDIYAFGTAASDELRIAYSSGIVVAGTVQTARFTDARVRTPNALFGGGTPPNFVLQSASLAGGAINNALVGGRFQLPIIADRRMLHIRPWIAMLGSTSPNILSGLSLCNVVVAGELVVTIEWDEYQLP